MGICGGGPEVPEGERKKNRNIDQKMQKDMEEDQNIFKLLLLGAGESGKSTLFKQMFLLYGDGFPQEELLSYRPVIFGNVITSMQTLVERAAMFAEENKGSGRENPYVVSASTDEVNGVKLDDFDEAGLDAKLAAAVGVLWDDPAIQATYARRSEYQLTDSTAYYMNKVTKIFDSAGKQYVPSEQDVLRSRARTTGVIENRFSIKGNKFRMFDVGGQRSERKKWIHCFENVTSVLFVVALSEFDQVLYEDQNTNRMSESIALFNEIVNNAYFSKTSMILFLNKRDLFQEKIRDGVSITKCPDLAGYNGPSGPNDWQPCAEYIRDVFCAEQEDKAAKEIYPHFTCATDTDNVNIVFESVRDIIIKESLRVAGLIR